MKIRKKNYCKENKQLNLIFISMLVKNILTDRFSQGTPRHFQNKSQVITNIFASPTGDLEAVKSCSGLLLIKEALYCLNT